MYQIESTRNQYKYTMNQRTTFNAYVLSVIDAKRICVRIDKDDAEKVSTRISSLCDKTTVKDTVLVNVSDCIMAISIPWKELVDLVGTHVSINCAFRKYSYYKKKVIYDENNDSRTTLVQCRGIQILGKKLSNIT